MSFSHFAGDMGPGWKPTMVTTISPWPWTRHRINVFLQKTIFRRKEADDSGVHSFQTKINKGAPNNSVLAGEGYF